ncbi:G-type lectin S-receptor-like serine/threonine-protein kinase At4g03230 isoform X2 [Prosopis cineraria]|uniref:G-type lectin S-receptor-like serine/threonine-protein kinase At4g03230 isoform X2 n=1 Tax=Prosopis cineraria TaxID=364024 RepID=UPI00240F4088|nr:G-type lectin S-receptor-like serine/threonine-protein kinase At4g03230 isoform X2 [Prosopis cineraria]
MRIILYRLLRPDMIAVFLLHIFLLCLPPPCLAGDTLKMGGRLLDSENDYSNLISDREHFELGFFSPPGSKNRYLGIWYHGKEPQTVVWVANRDNPIPDSTSGIFQISQDGNLTVLDTDGKPYWSYRPEQISSLANLTVKLMDTGNLLLGDDQLQVTYWQSFEHPTDTFLVGMRMYKDLVLTSWRATNDPGTGKFSFAMGKTGESLYSIYTNQTQLYWAGETRQDFGAEGKIISLLTNFTLRPTTYKSKNMSAWTVPSDFGYARLVMNYTGAVQLWQWDNIGVGGWLSPWHEPAEKCNRYNVCGNFGSCNMNNSPFCRCLPGFKSRGENQIPSSESGGCFQKTKSCGQNTKFIDLKKVKVRKPDKQVIAANETECRSKCLNGCPSCTAYSYDALRNVSRSSFFTCFIWTSDLPTVQEGFDLGFNLSVLVNIPDIEPTARTCKPCGAYAIPYPLSTDPSCGDPIYSNFKCDLPTGQVHFIVGNESFRVTNIDPDKRSFSIQISDSYDCAANDLGHRVALPFSATQQCNDDEEVKMLNIDWVPPNEPPCNNSIDCKNWPHSTCNVTRNANGRCLCDKNYQWNGLNLSCTQESPRRNNKTLILAVTFSSLILFACIITSAYFWRRKLAFEQEKGKTQRTRDSLHDSERYLKDLIDAERSEEKDNEGMEVSYLDFNSILLATDNFSDVNKLGRGGYGPVYKGKLPGGQDIAVKRLSSVSSQGLKEFKNEVVLISKLQHRNLVKLQGYCITGDEKILLYEYMPNKSLDTFLFDRTQRVILDWPMRFDIILGVARGMLYLHQDSRLRVVHRDLKTSNILLDEDMQPKISDFGLAKIFGGKETEANTERVVGTYGYMAPEYALDGFFSIKSDVFSFGIVMLEIISGRKNTGFFQSKQASSLLGYAWRLWTENNLVDLMDRSLSESCNANQFIKCAQVSLLCVQDEPGDRPTMSQVLIMLESEIASLPNPKQPTFFMTNARGLSSSASSSSKPEGILLTDISYQEGR